MSNKFNPAPQETITLVNERYVVQPHPSAAGVAFSAEGRRGTVYGIAKSSDKTPYALKVFKARYRNSALMDAARRLKQFENLEGMLAARRTIIEPTNAVARKYPELEYAMLMPWVEGATWFDVLNRLGKTGPVFDSGTAFALCNVFLSVMAGLERVGIAHTDISPGNVAVNEATTDVQLLDLEDLYVQGSNPPKHRNMGASGYNHPTADQGHSTWCPEGDRYATAILASEILLSADPVLSSRAGDNGLFGGNRYSQESIETFTEALPYLQSVAPNFAPLVEKAWYSAKLSDCPSVGALYTAIAKDTPIIPMNIPGVTWGGSSARTQTAAGPVTVTRQPGQSSNAQQNSSTPGVSWGRSQSVSTWPSGATSSGGSSVVTTQAGPAGVGGWLALFVFGLLVVNPLFAIAALITLNSPLAFFSNGFAVFSVITGICLRNQHVPRSVQVAKWFLVSITAYAAIQLVVSIFTNPPEQMNVALTQFFSILSFQSIWFLYLIKSKRVRATYGTN